VTHVSDFPAVVRGVLDASSLAEVSWRATSGPASGGVPQVRGVVALADGETPVLAFTWANEGPARSIAAAPEVVLTVTEPRSTGAAYRPVLLRGRPRMVEDPTGDLFCAGLLEQELRRYPPSRVYADSVLLRRENWWYLPRLLVHIDPDSLEPISERAPAGHLLVVDDGDRLAVTVATPAGGSAGRSEPRLALDLAGRAPGPGSAVLFGQDASFPDLEQWSQWGWRGFWDGGSLQVTEAPSTTGLEPVPGVWQRVRRQRALAKACQRALA
jgi:hypothetical protein